MFPENFEKQFNKIKNQEYMLDGTFLRFHCTHVQETKTFKFVKRPR